MFEVLFSPIEFYQRLQSLSRQAKRRVFVATLYVGNSTLERKLLETLSQNTEIDIHILLDGLRGKRKEGSTNPTSVEMIAKYCPKATIDAFTSPLYTGILKRLLPQRINEIVGTQHMKLFISDDTVLMTGANLSDIYFTNRQDRYLVVRNRELADELCVVIKNKESESKFSKDNISFSTQRGFLHESDQTTISLLTELLNHNRGNVEVILSSPYLNISRDIMSLLKEMPKVTVITNSIETNAFFNSKGPSKFIPEAYAILQDDLMKMFSDSKRYQFLEYSRSGWSFHPKGIWVSRDSKLSDTIIGSSNFGYRSRMRDLEVSFRIKLSSDQLRGQFHRELDEITKFCRPVAVERPRRPMWLKFLTRGPLRTFL
jgi:CDP-diacylglycerol--glycerol-3-phosphate 3-phosphatidyltransferase